MVKTQQTGKRINPRGCIDLSMTRPPRYLVPILAGVLMVTSGSMIGGGSGIHIDGPAEFRRGEADKTAFNDSGVLLAFRGNETGNWTKRITSPAPAARQSPGMVYNENDSVILLFGGKDQSGFRNDTWELDLETDTWKELKPLGIPTLPPPRAAHSMVFDRAHGAIIMYGGWADQNLTLNDTWAYHLSNRTWVQKSPVGSPPSRALCGMAFDDRNGVAVVFGGSDSQWCRQTGETWTYNLTENRWTNMSPFPAPSPRWGAGMTYDIENGKVVMFSGCYQGPTRPYDIKDTWAYDASQNAWSDMQPVSSPAERQSHQMGYDSKRGNVFLFGGASSQAGAYFVRNDTWRYDYAENLWTFDNNTCTPPSKYGFALAYDRVGDAVVIFGGLNSTGKAGDNDTWTYVYNDYEMNGHFSSLPLDTGGRSFFGRIYWKATTSSLTSVRLQLRTADTAVDLGDEPYIGPDGTSSSFYDKCGQSIFPKHNGSRWIQYKARLNTSYPLLTPVLENVSFTYNRIHDIAITFPTGGERLGGVQEIRWQASDPDNDSLAFDLYLHRGLSRFPLALNLSNGTRSYLWNTSQNESGTYRIRLVARDVGSPVPLQSEDLSFNFTVDNPPPPPPNNPPWVELLGPQDGLFTRETGVALEWQGYDDDGDALWYHVYASDSPFGADTLPAPRTTTSQRSFWLSGLAQGATYHWTVVASDGKDNGTVPEVRRFTILAPPSVNNPPTVTLLSPPDGSVLNATSVVLAWDAADPDGDNLTYSVFFGPERFDAAHLPAIAVSQTNLSCVFNGLTNGTSCWWTVTASDGKAQSAVPAVRKFTIDVTRGNHPPKFTGEPPLSARAGSLYEYAPAAFDDDGDNLTFSLPVRPDGMAVSPLTGKVSWTPRPKHAGGNTVVLRVMDSRGGLAEQQFVVDVSVALPVCLITFPKDNATLRADTLVKGTAARGLSDLWRVEVRIDGGPWAAASGTLNWTYLLRLSGLPPGAHRLEARAVEPEMASDIAAIDFRVGTAGTGPADGNAPWIPLGLILALGAASAALFTRGLLRRKP